MNFLLALAIAGGQAAAPPPPGLLFVYGRMVYFQHRAKQLHCGAGDLDSELEAIRRQLVRRYGKKAFPRRKPPPAMPGDCHTALSVYRVNLEDFRREAAAALNASPPAPAGVR